MRLSTDNVLITEEVLDNPEAMEIVWLKFKAGIPVEFTSKEDMKRFLILGLPQEWWITCNINHTHLIYDKEKHYVTSY